MENLGNQKIEVEKFKSFDEIAQMVGISKKTLRKRMGNLIHILRDGQRKALYSPEEVQIVLEFIGVTKSK